MKRAEDSMMSIFQDALVGREGGRSWIGWENDSYERLSRRSDAGVLERHHVQLSSLDESSLLGKKIWCPQKEGLRFCGAVHRRDVSLVVIGAKGKAAREESSPEMPFFL